MKNNKKGSATVVVIIIVLLTVTSLAFYYSRRFPNPSATSPLKENDIVGCYAGSLDGKVYMSFHTDNLYSIWNPDNQPSPSENGTWNVNEAGGLNIAPDNPDAFPYQVYNSVVKEGDKLFLANSSVEITLFRKECN